MKVLLMKPYSKELYKDMTDLICDSLEKYHGYTFVKLPVFQDGKDLKLWKPFDMELLKDKYDFIWAPYEPLIEVALRIKKMINAPVVGHFEIVPESKFSLEEIDRKQFEETKIADGRLNDYMAYKLMMDYYLCCDACTYLGQYEKYQMEKLYGNKIEKKLYDAPYTINNELFETLIEDVTPKHQIMSVFRLVSTKRAHHVIEALSLIDNPPKYVILGEGSEKEALEAFAKKLNVDVEFRGIVSDKEKAIVIQESLFSVHPWACLPIGETAFFKKPSICYFDSLVYERLGDLAVYVEKNNVRKLAFKIKELIDDESKRKLLGEKAHDTLINSKSRILLMKETSDTFNEIFKEGLQ